MYVAEESYAIFCQDQVVYIIIGHHWEYCLLQFHSVQLIWDI